MNKKIIIITVLGIIILAAAISSFWKSDVEKLLAESIEAIESENAPLLLSLLSTDYIEQYGLTQKSIEENLQRLFAQFDDIKIMTSDIDAVEQQNNVALITFKVKVVATVSDTGKKGPLDISVYSNSRYYLVGSPTQSGTVSLQLVKEQGKWKIREFRKFEVGYQVKTPARKN